MPVRINAPAVTQYLLKRFGFRGGYQATLDEVIVPVSVVDVRDGGDPGRAWGRTNIAAAAGELGWGRLFAGPSSSGRGFHITRLIVANQDAAALDYRLRTGWGAAATVVTEPLWRVTAQPGTPYLNLHAGTAAAVTGTTIREFSIPPGETLIMPLDVWLGNPSGGFAATGYSVPADLTVQVRTVNKELRAAWEWEEVSFDQIPIWHPTL